MENAGRPADYGSEVEHGGAVWGPPSSAASPARTRTFLLPACGLGPDAAPEVCVRWERCDGKGARKRTRVPGSCRALGLSGAEAAAESAQCARQERACAHAPWPAARA